MTFALKRVADWSTRFLFSVMAEDIIYRQGDKVSGWPVQEEEDPMGWLLPATCCWRRDRDQCGLVVYTVCWCMIYAE